MDTASAPAYQAEVVDRISLVSAEEWDGLNRTGYPFTRHAYLDALEECGCLGEQYGWLPRHLLVRDENSGQLVASVPMYEKHNSYGEFVFDWAWADAYQRSGLQYYPKLVAAIPYQPCPGPRFLIHPDYPADSVSAYIADALRSFMLQAKYSSVHCLFTDETTTSKLRQRSYLIRTGCQFHWMNHGYATFDAFLDTLSSRKRKKIRRERRRVSEAGITLSFLHGDEIDDGMWQQWHRMYCNTFDRLGGIPTLSLSFFQDIAHALPGNVLLVVARTQSGEVVAAAFNMVGEDTLYGRHWGCVDDYHSLHFETCYYQGLEYCIEHGLKHFQPGAQGEHKISRGFLPVPTYSAHWIADEHFAAAIGRYLDQETPAMQEHISELATRSPYRTDDL